VLLDIFEAVRFNYYNMKDKHCSLEGKVAAVTGAGKKIIQRRYYYINASDFLYNSLY
jgi:hypothetical protein